jgi:soluble lytic murein transglycosylase
LAVDGRLLSDLTHRSVARFNLLSPGLWDSMHDSGPAGSDRRRAASSGFEKGQRRATLGHMARTRSFPWRILLTLFLVGGALALVQTWRGRREHSQDKVILAAAQRYGVDPALVKAVVWRESCFNPRAVGRAGEVGLMQITEPAAREWAAAERAPRFVHSQLFDPGQNTLAGTWYLRKLLRRYPATDNPLPYALADYNAGRTHVRQWAKDAAATNSAAFIERIGFPMTRNYVQAVRQRQERYRADWPPPVPAAGQGR